MAKGDLLLLACQATDERYVPSRFDKGSFGPLRHGRYPLSAEVINKGVVGVGLAGFGTVGSGSGTHW